MIFLHILNLNLILFKISDNDSNATFFLKIISKIADIFVNEPNLQLFKMHTKGSGFTVKIITIILLMTIFLYFINIFSKKIFLLNNKQSFFFNPFILWMLAWIIDIIILMIRFFIFQDKYLDLQFLFVPSLIVWILFKVVFFRKVKNIDVSFLEDWLNYQTKFLPAKYFFNKISRNKEKNKSILFYWSIQVFLLDCTICTLRILIYGCLILGRLDFTISFIIFITMIYIYKKKLK